MIVATQTIGLLSALSLIMIGVFSEDFLAQHLFWSDLFFVLNLIVLVLANVTLFTRLNFIRALAYYGLGVAVINLLFVVLSTTPLLEWFTVFSALGYVALLAYNTRRL